MPQSFGALLSWRDVRPPSYNVGMSPAGQNQEPKRDPAEHFATTHWSLVLEAGRRNSPQSMAALATLCEMYWYALYAFIRRRGNDADEAQELTQAFFARILEKNDLA